MFSSCSLLAHGSPMQSSKHSSVNSVKIHSPLVSARNQSRNWGFSLGHAQFHLLNEVIYFVPSQSSSFVSPPGANTFGLGADGQSGFSRTFGVLLFPISESNQVNTPTLFVDLFIILDPLVPGKTGPALTHLLGVSPLFTKLFRSATKLSKHNTQFFSHKVILPTLWSSDLT